MKLTVVLLAGARHLTNPGIVPATLADIAFNIADGPFTVRHGACPGTHSADQTAADWMNDIGYRHGVLQDPMPADWDNCDSQCPPGHRRKKRPGDVAHPGVYDDYCPHAGPRRNARMVTKLPRPDWMIAFPKPGQPNYGTNGCIRLAEQAGIPVRRFTT